MRRNYMAHRGKAITMKKTFEWTYALLFWLLRLSMHGWRPKKKGWEDAAHDVVQAQILPAKEQMVLRSSYTQLMIEQLHRYELKVQHIMHLRWRGQILQEQELRLKIQRLSEKRDSLEVRTLADRNEAIRLEDELNALRALHDKILTEYKASEQTITYYLTAARQLCRIRMARYLSGVNEYYGLNTYWDLDYLDEPLPDFQMTFSAEGSIRKGRKEHELV